MRIPYLVVLFQFIFSCTQTKKEKEIDYTGFQERQIALAGYDTDYKQRDTLGLISLKISNRLDTFYNWIDYSCCTSCGFIYYRFADKDYSVYQDFSGMGYLTEKFPDSVYQLSIRFKPTPEAPDSIFNNLQIDTNNLGYHSPDPSFFKGWLIKEKRKINGRDFVILAYHDMSFCDSFRTKLVIKADAYFQNRMLEIIAECAAKDTLGFIDNIYKSFRSIQIKEKK